MNPPSITQYLIFRSHPIRTVCSTADSSENKENFHYPIAGAMRATCVSLAAARSSGKL